MKRPLLFTLFYYSEKIPPKKKNYYTKLQTFAAAVETVTLFGFRKKQLNMWNLSWFHGRPSQNTKHKKDDKIGILQTKKRDPFHQPNRYIQKKQVNAPRVSRDVKKSRGICQEICVNLASIYIT